MCQHRSDFMHQLRCLSQCVPEGFDCREEIDNNKGFRCRVSVFRTYFIPYPDTRNLTPETSSHLFGRGNPQPFEHDNYSMRNSSMGGYMSESVRQQIVISGLGGQGVLFVTRLLAEAAIAKQLPVFTSETHGMAQRGGTVLSHFKVGDFSSPLIRPYQADGLLLLKSENMLQHGAFLKPGGWAMINANNGEDTQTEGLSASIDADAVAQEIENPKASNLIVLGFALAQSEQLSSEHQKLFCSIDDIKDVLTNRFSSKKGLLDASLKALEAGYTATE